MTALTARPRGRSVLLLMALGGCGKLLGIDDTPVASECVSDGDCKSPLVCRNWECVSACSGSDCGSAGKGGSGGAGAEPGAGEAGMAPMSAGGASGGAGEGTGGTSPGGTPGTMAMAGAGGRGGSAGQPAGGTGAVSGGSGGTAGSEGGTGATCTDVGKCLVCNEDGELGSGECEQVCNAKQGCVRPPSCNGGPALKCAETQSCCLAFAVPGGSFGRSCDSCAADCSADPTRYPATVGAFALDAFEVTVARMHRFVDAYDGPFLKSGDGKNPRNDEDDGWETKWNEKIPPTRDALIAELEDPDCGSLRTFTENSNENSLMPVNCVTWYVAQAFCVWEGGRLPTEAEWDYVASGGQGRYYPWSDPAASTKIRDEQAVFGLPLGPIAETGSHDGQGRWFHYDLAGNVAEWVLDAYQSCYPSPDRCEDCGKSHSENDYRIARGGAFYAAADEVREAARSSALGASRYSSIGFRCAHDL